MMNDYWVIVADGAQARFMALERRDDQPPRAALRLVESAKLSNPEHTVKGRRDASKIEGARDPGHTKAPPHGFADHRESHDAELMRRFAERIGKEAAALTANGKASTMVLVADTRMLGLLHAALAPLAKAGVALRELARDYTWCTPPQVQQHLSENGLLPGAQKNP
jgi:protein required for attachment to host cells